MGAERSVLLERVGADGQGRMFFGQDAQRPRDLALGQIDAQRLAEKRGAALDGRQDRGDHRLEHGRDARHDMHVLQREAGSDGNRVLDQRRAVWNAGHTHPALGRLGAALLEILHEEVARVVADVDMHVEGRRHAIRGDIVMGRPDAA